MKAIQLIMPIRRVKRRVRKRRRKVNLFRIQKLMMNKRYLNNVNA